MVAALSPEDQANVIQQATLIAQQQGITPERAFWNYIQSNGIAPEDADAYMGWTSGTTTGWAVNNGLAPAVPQAAPVVPQPAPAPVVPPAPAPVAPPAPAPVAPAPVAPPSAVSAPAAPAPAAPAIQPLSAADRASVIQQAQAIAAQQNIAPEQALYNYAQSQGLSNTAVDTAMGWPAGTTQTWAVQNGQAPAPQGNSVQTPAAAPSPVPAAVQTPAPAPVAQTPAVQPLSEADKASVIEQAKQVAAAQGISPQQALYNYAQTNNISSPQVDLLMGWPTGTTQSWAVQNGQAPAPQGNYTFNINNQLPAAPVTPAAPAVTAPAKTPVQPLDAATRASVIQQAQTIAGQQNITPEQALYNYAKTQGIDSADVDTYMGWPAGTTSAWATKNAAPAPVKTAAELKQAVAPAGVYGLDPAARASIIQQATDIGRLQGISPEQALYNYAQTQHLSNSDVDTYMGFDPGATAAWAGTHLPAQTAPGALSPVVPAATTQAGPLTTANPAPYQPQYKTPAFNALYSNQQQRMSSTPPKFNFQQPEQPGALTNVISAT